MWSRGQPRREEAAQLLFLGIASGYATADGVIVEPVDNLGRWPFVLKSASGASLSALVEVKLARNGRFRNGLSASIPRYRPVELHDVCWILVLELTTKDVARITEINAALSGFDADARPAVKFVDASWTSNTGGSPTTNITITAGNNSPVHLGDRMGDSFNVQGDVTGSAMGRGAVVWARDITSFKDVVNRSELDEALKTALNDSRDAVETANLSQTDMGVAIDTLGQLTEEFQKPAINKGRLAQLGDKLKALVPLTGEFLGALIKGYTGLP
jgi:hypothetical protein